MRGSRLCRRGGGVRVIPPLATPDDNQWPDSLIDGLLESVHLLLVLVLADLQAGHNLATMLLNPLQVLLLGQKRGLQFRDLNAQLLLHIPIPVLVFVRMPVGYTSGQLLVRVVRIRVVQYLVDKGVQQPTYLVSGEALAVGQLVKK